MERKAFNFFKSYYDVAKELNDKERLAFYDALILEQFTGKKTDLKGMAKFAYVSQQHSIDAQINGFNQRLKRGDTDLKPLSTLPPAIGGTQGAAIQEKEEEKGEEKVNNIDSRKLKFASTLKPYLEVYGRDMLNDFYAYWTEPNKSNTKFRKELEKTWSLQRRLAKWASNEKIKPTKEARPYPMGLM